MEHESIPLLQVQDLTVWFPAGRTGIFSLIRGEKKYVRAVDGVTFNVNKGEVFSLIGESGAGKTTIGLTIAGVYKPTRGKILFKGIDINSSRKIVKNLRRKIQMIFQDPFESLPPHMTIFDIVREGIDIHKLAGSFEEKIRMVKDALENVGLSPPEEFFNKYPHQLSGGQRQRVAIASTLVLHPDLIIADEPVSMIDASLRWSIIELMMNLRRRYGLTYIFILHDLALAKYISTHLAILYLGQIVELGTSNDVIKKPMHPYTRALMSVVPSLRKTKNEREKIILRGEIPNPVDLPTGCRFHPRCPYASSSCERENPELIEVEQNHYVRCLKI